MAINDGEYPVEADLFVNPTNYTTGGTNLGLLGSGHLIGFNKDVELLSKAPTGSQYTDARILGMNLIYEIIILNRATAVMNLMFDGESATDIFEGYNSYLLGHPVGASQTSKLLLRPTTATNPYLYIPRALVIDLGPIQFDHRGELQEATRLTLVALLDTSRDSAYSYGDQANLTAI